MSVNIIPEKENAMNIRREQARADFRHCPDEQEKCR